MREGRNNAFEVLGSLAGCSPVKMSKGEKPIAYRWVRVRIGEVSGQSDFVSFIAFGPVATTAGDTPLGSLVKAAFRIKSNSYDKPDGSGKKYSQDLILESMQAAV